MRRQRQKEAGESVVRDTSYTHTIPCPRSHRQIVHLPVGAGAYGKCGPHPAFFPTSFRQIYSLVIPLMVGSL